MISKTSAGGYDVDDGVKVESFSSILRGLSISTSQKVDLGIVEDLRNFVHGPLRGGDDLMSIDIMRSRDAGLPDYNTCRERLGLTKKTTFESITSNTRVVNALKQLYGNNISNIDAYVGAFAEDHSVGSSVGPLIDASFREQFERLRKSDIFWYENTDYYTADEISEIYGTNLRQLILRNFPDISSSALPVSTFYQPKRQLLPLDIELVAWSKIPNSPPNLQTLKTTPLFNLQFAINFEREEITFVLQSVGTGWVGIGFEPQNHTMKGSDIIIARINPLTNQSECRDSFSLDVGIPVLDTRLNPPGTDDIIDCVVIQDNKFTSAMFTRKLVTGDTIGDKNILASQIKVIYAFNPISNYLTYHGPTRNSSIFFDFVSSMPVRTFYAWDSSWSILFSTFAAIFVAIYSSSFVVIWMYRHENVIKKSITMFLCLILVGLIMISSSLFFWPGEPTEVTCAFKIWLPFLGFSLSYGSLLVKNFYTLQVYRIARKKFKNFSLSRLQLLVYLLVISGVVIFVLLIWQITSPYKASSVLLTSRTGQMLNLLVCRSESDTSFAGFLIGYCIILLFAGFLVSFQTRRIPVQYNETIWMAYVTYALLIISIIGVPISFAIYDYESSDIVVCTGLLIVPFTIYLSIYIPKWKVLFVGEDVDEDLPTSRKDSIAFTQPRTKSSGDIDDIKSPNHSSS
eukprot:TRINITY_DN5960_c0_g1_i1.p1 TRINITY_DN5960_c0_g1~~TRINITY_DN5960_c0_g1_i1.p1  ORF type:complete len:684 (+),score=108.85 TRINITY_DN5960_c0_g1_i1:1085-3136(+)